MSRDDLQKFWSQNFVPNNAALIVSGQITDGGAQAAGRKGVRRLGQRVRRRRRFPAKPTTAKARLVLVDKPGAPQTQLRVASIGGRATRPTTSRLRVMNETLGGLFSSRINLNLREEHGYTYGASSQFVFRRAPGPFLVATGVRTDVTGARGVRDHEGAHAHSRRAMSPEELTLAKDSLVRSLPADFETSGRVNATTANMFVYDLGLDYYAKLPDRLPP